VEAAVRGRGEAERVKPSRDAAIQRLKLEPKSSSGRSISLETGVVDFLD
jgi:hypothetical protein